MVDANGAYRAKVELSLDNSSEQFLDVELPEGATLWTVHVAGEPVKPAQVPGAEDARHVLLPVRKTAKGDPNYLVVLKYGGKMPPLSVMSTVQFPLVRNVKSYPRRGQDRHRAEPGGDLRSQVAPMVRLRRDDARDRGRGRPQGRPACRLQQAGAAAHRGHARQGSFARARARENLKNWVAEARKNASGEAGRDGRDVQ